MTPEHASNSRELTPFSPSVLFLENRILFARSLQSSKISAQARELISSACYPWDVLSMFTQKLKERIAGVPASQRVAGEVAAGAVLHGDEVVIEAGARVEDFAVIKSPTYLAAGVVVRSAAYLRGGVWAEQGALIGHSAEIKASLLLPGAKAAHQCYVGDCILGQGGEFGCGHPNSQSAFR